MHPTLSTESAVANPLSPPRRARLVTIGTLWLPAASLLGWARPDTFGEVAEVPRELLSFALIDQRTLPVFDPTTATWFTGRSREITGLAVIRAGRRALALVSDGPSWQRDDVSATVHDCDRWWQRMPDPSHAAPCVLLCHEPPPWSRR